MQAGERGSEVKEQEGLVFCYDRPQADKVLVLRANPAKPSSEHIADTKEHQVLLSDSQFVIQSTSQDWIQNRLK